MVDEIDELKILLNLMHSTKIPSQAEAAKKTNKRNNYTIKTQRN